MNRSQCVVCVDRVMSITQVKPFVTLMTILDKLKNSNHEISESDLRDRGRHWSALNIPGND